MKRTKFSDEQIIGILREQEAGTKTSDLCRKHGMAGSTFYAWKAEVKAGELLGKLAVTEAERVVPRRLNARELCLNLCRHLHWGEQAGQLPSGRG